jgi:DHA1 family tetracycline resistance protein-like MFS transporter
MRPRLVAAYLVCYAVHGAACPVHNGLLHRQVDGPYRASLLSLNSMVSQPAAALGLVTLTAVASAASLRVSLLVGAGALAVAAPLYLVARGAAAAPPSMTDVQDGVYARPVGG